MSRSATQPASAGGPRKSLLRLAEVQQPSLHGSHRECRRLDADGRVADLDAGAYRVSAAMMTSPAGTPAIADRNSHAPGFARLKVQPTPKRAPTISAGSPELT